ncbi:MAG TPA: hypothetical protein VKU02_22820 [Gemmataceae bacterium]|nr:hypothetical protein [Gemmataceae bacterium]
MDVHVPQSITDQLRAPRHGCAYGKWLKTGSAIGDDLLVWSSDLNLRALLANA